MLCGITGALMAAETLKVITGIGKPLVGRVAQYDALDARWQEYQLTKDPETSEITALEDYEKFCGTADTADETFELISADELGSLLRQRDEGSIVFEFIDVREKWEHDANPLPGSRLVPLGRLNQLPELAGPNKAAPIILHCQSGARSGRAARVLTRAGYTNVRSLAGGAAAWSAASPVNP